MAKVLEMHGPESQVATVWHPEAIGEVLDTPHGNVRVLTGPAAYQFSSGAYAAI